MAYELDRRNGEIDDIKNILDSKTKYFDQQVLELTMNYESEFIKLKNTFSEKEKTK